MSGCFAISQPNAGSDVAAAEPALMRCERAC